MAPRSDLQVTEDGVAVITLNNPPVNALHPDRKPLQHPVIIESFKIFPVSLDQQAVLNSFSNSLHLSPCQSTYAVA